MAILLYYRAAHAPGFRKHISGGDKDTTLHIVLASVSQRKHEAIFASPVDIYLARVALYAKAEKRVYRTEDVLMEATHREGGRVATLLVLLDSRGRQLSSEQLASWIGAQREGGQQRLIFAVGPADGWSEEARERAGMLLSLGPMTLPHELARVVLVEQVYRAFTILAGHPYHSGH